jgi:hypothetical protein
MPLIKPQAISNRVRLAYEFAALVRSFIAKHGTVDAALPLSGSLVDAVVLESPPNENSIPCCGSQDNLFSGTAKQPPPPSVSVFVM